MLNSQLLSLCETRWVGRHDAFLAFSVELSQIIDALDNISKWNDRTSSIKARILLLSVRESDFIVSLGCAVHVFFLTNGLSQLFQKKSLDLDKAKNCIKDLLIVLKHKRKNCKEMFKEIFRAAEKTFIEKNGSFNCKRIVQRQTCRENIPSDSIEEYYRRSISIPLFDALILDISALIVKTLSAFSNVYGFILGLSIENLPAPEFTSEVELQQCKCISMKDEEGITSLPTDLSVVFDLCDQVQYPITHKLFKIIKTCPVSVASAERSFSTLRRIKNLLRTQMTENRLVGLVLLNVHREIPVNVEKVIDRFVNSGNRKLEFVI
ncbi:52 kDa repressor of the inhibitor of the protein kinase-like [Hydra vulgaris]|uniref:52 kDa repressor of the inhibitor of the protein kinase-like n=1 Tax=Hydra vulgaris TaxID=6087 RepID=UPI0032E9C506